jgi:phage-related protein
LPAVFFRTETGREPVREWLKDLPKDERRIIGEDIMTVQFRWPLGMPLVDNLGSGIWEVRSKLPTRIARTLFFVHEGEIVLLHGLIKKTAKNSTGGQGFSSPTEECLHQKQQKLKTNIAEAASGAF